MRKRLSFLLAWVTVSVSLWGVVIFYTSRPSNAQVAISGGVSQDQLDTAIAAVTSAIPTPLAAVPPGPAGAGTVGSGLSYVPGNALQKQTVQRTTVTTNSSGVWTVTWATSFISASPTINPIPLNATPTNPIVCNPTARTATTATGQCWTGATNTNALLSLVISLAPTATAANTPVMVIGAEPTQ